MSSITLASGLRLSFARQGEAIDPAVLLLPGPTYHGVGHTPRWEKPTRFSRDLAAFIRQQTRSEV